MKKVIVMSSLLAGAVLLFSGCARNMSANSYSAKAISGQAMESYPCTVLSVRKVMIEESDYLEDNKTGALLGAVAGGVGGNMIGQGKGRTLATGLGALAGAAAGAYAEKALKQQEGFEYIVRLDNGKTKTVVQGTDTILAPGQRAILIEGNGRARLVAAA